MPSILRIFLKATGMMSFMPVVFLPRGKRHPSRFFTKTYRSSALVVVLLYLCYNRDEIDHFYFPDLPSRALGRSGALGSNDTTRKLYRGSNEDEKIYCIFARYQHKR